MHYVDGFVVPVPTAKKDEYRRLAETAAAVFKENGMKRAMDDPRLQQGMQKPPFDAQRMIFGGFQMIVNA